MSDTHTCPRRVHEWGPWERTEGVDGWSSSHGLVTSSEPACTFCGSLPGERFIELIETGYVVGPTDKDYKAYVNEPVSEAKAAEWVAAHRHSAMGRALLEAGGEEALAAWLLDGPGPQGMPVGKIYFQHLDADQRARFIQLHNTQQMAIGYPFRFYRLPYFCAAVAGGV